MIITQSVEAATANRYRNIKLSRKPEPYVYVKHMISTKAANTW